jgi:protoporphyrinogen oxidase
MKSRETAKIAVVGAGMAGLTATQKLLAGGAEVTLFDKSQGPGGRASTLKRDSFFLNQGPHALYKGGAAYEILTKLNINPAGASPAPKRSLAILKGEILDLPIDATSIVATKLLSIVEKIEWGMLMGGLAKTDLSKLHNVTLNQWLKSTVKSERVQELFTALVRLATYCNSPEKISAAAAIQQLVLVQKDGVLYLDCGWQSLVDSMVQLIRSEGKDKLTEIYEAEVSAISVNTGGLQQEQEERQERDQVEITINGAKQNFDAVILALPPKQVSRLLATGSSETKTLQTTSTASCPVMLLALMSA